MKKFLFVTMIFASSMEYSMQRAVNSMQLILARSAALVRNSLVKANTILAKGAEGVLPKVEPVVQRVQLNRGFARALPKLNFCKITAGIGLVLSMEATEHIAAETRFKAKTLNQADLPQEAIAEALQSEAAFTQANDSKYILATYGCGSCVAVAGYDETNQVAFIVHFANKNEVKQRGGLIFYNLRLLLKQSPKTPIKLHLRGGIKGLSEEIVQAIKIWMRICSDLPMEIISENILNGGCEGKSLLINSKTSEVGNYESILNPHHRTITDSDFIRCLLSTHRPSIVVSYKPKIIN